MVTVSIIVPCYNEEQTIPLLLTAIAKQTFPLTEMEVIIADGLSQDHTREQIGVFTQGHPLPHVRVIDNPARIIPAALNKAIAAAAGEYIIRLDAHSQPKPDYVERCIQALCAGQGDNIGGVWEIQPFSTQDKPPSWIARSIAAAAAHPFGVGDARYRYADKAQAVETVPFGAFHRNLIERIGGFDETLLTNEDYEFNVRILQAKGRVWLDPAIRSVYYARATLGGLSLQYWRYGYWKGRMLSRYPHSLRWRQALPPLFIFSLFILTTASPWLPIALWLLSLELVAYLALLGVASLHLAIKKNDPILVLGVPFAIATMHFSWGIALIWSLSLNWVGKFSRSSKIPEGKSR